MGPKLCTLPTVSTTTSQLSALHPDCLLLEHLLIMHYFENERQVLSFIKEETKIWNDAHEHEQKPAPAGKGMSSSKDCYNRMLT